MDASSAVASALLGEEFELVYVDADGVRQRGPLSLCWSVQFERVGAVRRFTSRQGQRSFAGSWFFATSGEHVGYCREWSYYFWTAHLFHERVDTFERQGCSTRFRDDPAVEAATYPEIVALANLFASPYWRHQAVADNLDPDPFDNTLCQGPALTRFIAQIQSKVHPDYRFSPWRHYGKFPPITEWIMNEIEAIQNPDDYRAWRSPLPPERFDDEPRVPKPRTA